jgi:hypothetical protein
MRNLPFPGSENNREILQMAEFPGRLKLLQKNQCRLLQRNIFAALTMYRLSAGMSRPGIMTRNNGELGMRDEEFFGIRIRAHFLRRKTPQKTGLSAAIQDAWAGSDFA